MYPLNMKNAAGGYAVANTEDEHQSLSNAGYEPKWTEPEDEAPKPSEGLNVAALKEALTAKGIDIPEGAKKADLAALLDAAE